MMYWDLHTYFRCSQRESGYGFLTDLTNRFLQSFLLTVETLVNYLAVDQL